MNHVRVHIESNEKSNIPKGTAETKKLTKRQVMSEPYYQQRSMMPAYPLESEPFREKEYKPRIHVNVETDKRSQIHPSWRNKRDLAAEYAKHIMVPDRAEDNLGVVHQKRVDEDYEYPGKRNKILKLVKRQIYEQPMYMDPRATIRGTKVIKNPILQLLRAAAGQKTQRILGLNSKAFDIFPGPLPDERNMALNNNLGRVTSEAPSNRFPEVNQQIMRNFQRPSLVRRQPFVQGQARFMTMYPQRSQQQQILQDESPEQEYSQRPVLQQQMYPQPSQHQQQVIEDQLPEQEYTPEQEYSQRPVLQQRQYTSPPVLQQRQYTSPQQWQQEQQQPQVVSPEMAPMRRFPQFISKSQGFTEFAPFTRRRSPSYIAQQQQQEQFQESAAMLPQREMFPNLMPGEDVIPQQVQQQQMFMRPASPVSYPMEQREILRPQRLQEAPAQVRQQLPRYQEQPEFYEQAEQRSIPSKPSSAFKEMQKIQSIPEMRFNEQTGRLVESQQQPSEAMMTGRVPLNPLEESQDILGGSLRNLIQSPTLSSKLYQLPTEDLQRSLLPLATPRHYLSEMPLPRYMPYHPAVGFARPRHVVSRIPRPIHREEDDDEFDEKPEVHVHIQTEKSLISKPSDETSEVKSTNESSGKAKS